MTPATLPCPAPPLPPAQEAADDLRRILAELEVLEAQAGAMNRSAAAGGSAASAEVGEGADVQELE